MGVGKSTFTFSTSSITIDGGSTIINITRDNQSYSHKVLHGYGDIATLAVGTTSYTWKPTASALTKFFQEVPAQKSRLIDVYLDTYNGSTKVGRDVHSLTVTLSEATGKPSISGFAITDSNTTTNGWGVIVDGKSTLTASATPTGKYGATISRNIFACTYNGKTYESYYINDLIASLPLTTTPTSFTIGYKSTDSRGFSTTTSLSKTVAKYQAPNISTFEVIRCNTSGVEADNGTKAKVIIKGSWAAIKVGTAYKNAATLKVGYKTKAATSYTYQTISVSAGTVNISQLLSATLTAGTDYEFSVQLTDSFTSDTKTGVGCSNVANILYVSADGKEMVIGSDNGNNVAIDSDSVDIRDGSTVLATFGSNKIELGKNSESSIISLCGGKGALFVNESNAVQLSSSTGTQIYASSSNDTEQTSSAGANGMTVSKGCIAQAELFANATDGKTDSKHAGIVAYASKASGDERSSLMLDADKIHVSGSFTEDIPNLISGNCNNLKATGKYYIGNYGTNRPVAVNGWLESKLYSTDYCYQIYTTYTGQIYRRLMSAGTWSAWSGVLGLTQLWSGTLGKGGSVNIPTINRYTLFAVQPGDNGILLTGVPFVNQLHCVASNDDGTNSYTWRASFSISGTTVKLFSSSSHLINGTGGASMTITKIYGLF